MRKRLRRLLPGKTAKRQRRDLVRKRIVRLEKSKWIGMVSSAVHDN